MSDIYEYMYGFDINDNHGTCKVKDNPYGALYITVSKSGHYEWFVEIDFIDDSYNTGCIDDNYQTYNVHEIMKNIPETILEL